MKPTTNPTLRQRIANRYGTCIKAIEPIEIASSGQIDPSLVQRLSELAASAQGGSTKDRDMLFFSMQPRLERVAWILKPFPNTPDLTGIWDREDVCQETFLVFVELLELWDSETDFVTFLLARFPWRLRDRILRGIGRLQRAYGGKRIPEELLAELLFASESEQPEPVAIANRVLEKLIVAYGLDLSGERDTLMKLIRMRRPVSLERVIEFPEDEQSLSQIDAA